MFLFKRNGIYYLEYEEPRTGRKKRISTKQKMKRDALTFVSNFKKVLEEKNKAKATFYDQFSAEYINLKEKSSSVSYIRSIKYTLLKFGEEIGNPLCEDIGYNQIEKFIMNLYKDSPSLASLHYRTLKAAFNKATEWEYVKVNPLLKLKLPRAKVDLPLFINVQELESILENVQEEQLKELYRLALHTGLRLNEILNLRWCAIDFQAKTLKVEHHDAFITKGKKERIIPLNSIILEILSKKAIKIKLISINQNDYVFCKCKGVKLEGDFVSKKFKKAVRKTAGMNPKFHLHQLRHSFGSLLVQRGVSLYVIKELLGHTDLKTTQIYSHLQQDSLIEAVKVLEK